MKTGRPVDPNSLSSRLKAEGIPRRSYYTVREELADMGVEATKEDIIEICKVRRKTPLH